MSYKRGCRIRKITHLPGFVLKILGAFDARDGTTDIAEERIRGYLKRADALVEKEILVSSNRALKPRQAGAKLLILLSEDAENRNCISWRDSPVSPYDIRHNRRSSSAAASFESRIETRKTELSEINEKLLMLSDILDMRIDKTCDKAEAKISAYIRGVRKQIDGFDPELAFSQTAYNEYVAKHEKGDTAIAANGGF